MDPLEYPPLTLEQELESKRRQAISQFLGGWSLLGRLISSDTYKRTMWATDDELSQMFAAYHLTARRGLPETGAKDRLIMAGHEWMLRQWFLRPLNRRDIELAMEWYTKKSAVKYFPVAIFEKLLNNQSGDFIHLPIDVWGFAGGQTFLAKVPFMSFEGVGGIVSFVEPQMVRYYGPIIHATKGRLMYEAAGVDHAEFGYRADPNELMSIAKLLSIYVGNGGNRVLTSCDIAEFMFPERFKAIGTVGHEFIGAKQDFQKTLMDAEREAMDLFATHHETASLLCDLIDAETIGLENAIWVMKKHSHKKGIGIRVDSGNIKEQCVQYYFRMKKEGIDLRTIVFEDEVTPDKIREVMNYFFEKTGIDPKIYAHTLIPGAGGYYYRQFHRDTVSLGMKRSMTGDQPNMKFSNSPGKESVPGRVRVYERGDKLIIADASEEIDGRPLFVKLVENGRIINPEDMNFEAQAQRVNETWGRYRGFEFSPKIKDWMNKFITMRDGEQSIFYK